MRQQFLDPTGRLRGQPLQHVLEVGVRIVAIDVGRVHQLMTAAARWPARRLPANSQFDLPSAIGLIWFSTQLLEMGTSPSSM